MIRRPTLRGISLVATSSLLALLVISPASTLAATPNLTAYATAQPALVSAGGAGGFIVGIHNGDSSTVSQLYMTGTFDGGAFTATPSQGTCTGLACSFGQLKPGKDVTVIVQYTAATADGVVATITVDFNTTGLGSSSGGDSSHGDHWAAFASSTTTTDTLNDAGTFLAGTNRDVHNNLAVNSTSNHQSTRVIAPKTLIGVSVSDGTAVDPATCPAPLVCFAEESYVEVAAGADFSGGFQVIITIDGSLLAKGVNASNVKIYHTWGSNPVLSEVISTRCSFSNGLPTTTLPCLNAAKVGGNLQITIWTRHNGFMKPAG